MPTPPETTASGRLVSPSRGIIPNSQRNKVKFNVGGATTVSIPVEARQANGLTAADFAVKKPEPVKPLVEIRASDFALTGKTALNGKSGAGGSSLTTSGRMGIGGGPISLSGRTTIVITGSIIDSLSINGQVFGLNRSETYALAKAEEELTKRRSQRAGIISVLEASRTIRRTAEQALLMTRRAPVLLADPNQNVPLKSIPPEQAPGMAYNCIVGGELGTAKRYLMAGDASQSEEDYWAVWSELGNAYWERGQFTEAGHAYQTACDMFPERLISQFNMGTAQLMASDFAGAMESFKRADRIQGKDPKVLCNIAATHFLQHEYEKAEEILFKTISVRPEYVRALNTLAGVLGASKRLDKAMEVCDRVLLLNPNHAEAAFKKGIIHLTNNEASEAVAPLELAMSSPDLKFEAQCFMARTLSFLNKCDQAETFMQETPAVTGVSDHVLVCESWKAIGLGWKTANEVIRAVEAFRKAAEVSPKDPEIWLDLGLAYSRISQADAEALKCFQAFLRLKSDNSRKATVTSFPSVPGVARPLRTVR